MPLRSNNWQSPCIFGVQSCPMKIGVSLTGALRCALTGDLTGALGYAYGSASQKEASSTLSPGPLIVFHQAHKPAKDLLAADAAGKGTWGTMLIVFGVLSVSGLFGEHGTQRDENPFKMVMT